MVAAAVLAKGVSGVSRGPPGLGSAVAAAVAAPACVLL